MRAFVEIVIGLLLIIPLTQLMTVDLTASGGFLFNATSTSVGDEGPFILMLFKFWPILFGLGLLIIAILLARRKIAGWKGFGNEGEER